MNYGFTGSKHGCEEKIITTELAELHLTDKDTVVTGACFGIDSQVSHIVKRDYPSVKQKIVVPSNRKCVDVTVFKNGEVIEMPKGTSYRYRNEYMVKISDKMTAFWNGNKRSGTYMTMNIAKRQNKLHKIIII